MTVRLNSFIDEITEDPVKKKTRLAAETIENDLATMQPWLSHLEKNPNLKKWAEANPEASSKERDKFLEKLEGQGQTNQLSSSKKIHKQMGTKLRVEAF